MLNLSRGYKIINPEELSEGFEFSDENTITANIDSEKIIDVVQHFICIQDEPLFFILELPVESYRETPIRDGVVDKLHKDIYFIDGCSKDECLAITIKYGDLLESDGMSNFGFGCHDSNDEIMVGAYNIVNIYSDNISKYNDFYEPHEIKKVGDLKIAYDTFSAKTPGSKERIDVDGISVYDLPEILKEWGIYLAETVEDE